MPVIYFLIRFDLYHNYDRTVVHFHSAITHSHGYWHLWRFG
uniref:Uncharacterized protein n=1 Tax=Anguilla anguilla TaxID=7936 RepID=A0A0E9VPU2_ANGAN